MKSLHAACLSVFRHKRSPDTIAGKLNSNELRKSVEANESKALFSRVYDEIKAVKFEEAWGVVSPFSLLMERLELQKCPLFLNGRAVMDSGFYSSRNLTCSRAKTLTAFKAYFVLVPDDVAAWATSFALTTRVARVVPDGRQEPLQFEDFDALNLESKELDETLVAEMSVLEFLRTMLHSPSVAKRQ